MSKIKINSQKSDGAQFMECVKGVFEKLTGLEQYGNETEFYDEDGVVLVKVSLTEDPEIVNVYFAEGDLTFSVNKSKIALLYSQKN